MTSTVTNGDDLGAEGDARSIAELIETLRSDGTPTQRAARQTTFPPVSGLADQMS
jgi:hypothetical protein